MYEKKDRTCMRNGIGSVWEKEYEMYEKRNMKCMRKRNRARMRKRNR